MYQFQFSNQAGFQKPDLSDTSRGPEVWRGPGPHSSSHSSPRSRPRPGLQAQIRESLIKEAVLICFDWNNQNACFQYNDEGLAKFVSSNEYHFLARLGHYQNKIITVGCTQKSQSYGYFK